jgi:hypothetical protein
MLIPKVRRMREYLVSSTLIQKEDNKQQGGKMRTIALALLAVVALSVIGCQPPEGMAGPTQEQFDALKAQVDGMQMDLDAMKVAYDSLTAVYNEHIEKFHKSGGTKAPAVKPKPPVIQK